jgi:hypothetical protein
MSLHLIALLFLLTPAPQNWTIDFNVTVDISVSVVPPVAESGDPAAAVTETDCDALMALYNAAADQSDPYERAGAETDDGEDACRKDAGVPAR